jgi:hypothetical protein
MCIQNADHLKNKSESSCNFSNYASYLVDE